MDKLNNIIEFRGFNNIFVGLMEDDNKYYLFISKYHNPIITVNNNTLSTFDSYYHELIKLTNSYECKFEMNFNLLNNNTLFNIINLQNKEEYYTIVKVLEITYGK